MSIGASNASWPVVVGAFGLAWIAGFLIPGAPAGLGVREALFVALIAPEVGAGAALACAILHRLVTAIADLVVALGGYTWFVSAARSKK